MIGWIVKGIIEKKSFKTMKEAFIPIFYYCVASMHNSSIGVFETTEKFVNGMILTTTHRLIMPEEPDRYGSKTVHIHLVKKVTPMEILMLRKGRGNSEETPEDLEKVTRFLYLQPKIHFQIDQFSSERNLIYFSEEVNGEEVKLAWFTYPSTVTELAFKPL